MPTSAADAFAVAGTPKPLEPTIESESPAKAGETASEVFKRIPQKPSALAQVGEKVGSVAKKAVAAAAPLESVVATNALKPYLDDYVEMSHQYADALKADAKAYPEGTLNQLLQSGKTLNDMIGYYFTPVISPLYTGVIKPLQAGIQKISDFAKAHVEDAAYDAQKQREGVPYIKGKKGFGINAADVERTADFLKTTVEALTLAGAGFIGPKEAPTMERPVAGARTALRDLKSAVAPPEPKLAPITVSLDKTMGFGGVVENYGKPVLSKIPVGSTRSAASIVDDMIPHAEGYAKSFLEKLAEHVDPQVTVRFKTIAGSDPNYAGVYRADSHQVELKAGRPDDIVHTAVHEIVHSATVNMIDTLMDADMKAIRAEASRDLTTGEKLAAINNPRSAVLKELDAVIKEARVRAQKAGREFYGLQGSGRPAVSGTAVSLGFARMSPRYEFVAELFSNPELQEFLANSEKYASAGYKWKNMLNQLGNLIGRHLGMDKPYELQLLNQSMAVGSRLMRMQAAGEAGTERGFLRILGRTENGETITQGDIDRATQIPSVVRFPGDIKVHRPAGDTSETVSVGGFKMSMGQAVKSLESFLDKDRAASGVKKEYYDNPFEVSVVKLNEDYVRYGFPEGKQWSVRVRNVNKSQSVATYATEEQAKAAADFLRKRGEYKFSEPEIGRLIDSKGVRQAKTSLAISVEQILRAVSPESLGRNVKLAAAAIASRITERMQRDAYWQTGSDTRLKFWRARPDMTREFINKFEKGEAFSDPALRQLAERYRAWGARIADHDKQMGFDYDPRENYLAHIFEDQDGVAEYFQRKYGSKWGNPSFVKDRTFDLYKEAVAAGFRPRFDNPEDIMLARQHASDIASMHTSILKDLEKYGLATLKVVGKEELKKTFDSEGRASFNIVKTEGTKQPSGSVRWRAPNGDVYWLDPRADAVMQNAFKSKSLWEDRGLGGTLFRGAMSLKNALVPIRLALSLFHPLHVVGIDASAGMTRALSGMLSGTTPIHRGLAEMLGNGLFYKSIWENPKSGWRVMKAWQGKIPASELTEADARALQTLVEMGISPDMSVQYRTNARKNFLNAVRDASASFRQGQVLGGAGDAARAVWHLPWATVSALSKPIFEVWIPALKAASAIKDAENLLRRSPELAEDDVARHLAMRRLGKSVENRYGEMNYSTLFWKRWVKDLSVLDTLSLGWQLGFIREYGGGMMDLGQWVKDTDKMQQIKRGQLDKAIFVSSYTTLGAAVGGLMTWAMSGTPPTSLLDYISPRTGEKNPDGSDARVSTMFYHREFASLYKHIQNEGVVPGVSELVLNKGSGLFGLMHEWATGVNGFGQEIRDPDGDAFQKLEQTLAYSMSDIEPISMKAIQQNVSEQPVKQGVLTVLGFTPAPKYLTESTTTAHIKQAFSNYVAPKQTPFEKAEFSKEYSQLRQQYQTGSDQFGESLRNFAEKNQLSGQDQRRLMRSLNSTLLPEQRMFMRLPWQEQIKILNSASPEERDLLLPHSNREHVRSQWAPPQ